MVLFTFLDPIIVELQASKVKLSFFLRTKIFLYVVIVFQDFIVISPDLNCLKDKNQFYSDTLKYLWKGLSSK